MAGQQVWEGGLCLSELQEDVDAEASQLTLQLSCDFSPDRQKGKLIMQTVLLLMHAVQDGDVNTLQIYGGHT